MRSQHMCASLSFPRSSVTPCMLVMATFNHVNASMINNQLAVIAATVDSSKRLHDQDILRILPTLFTSWRQISRRSIEVGARDRAWRSTRTQQALVKSLEKWTTWLRRNRYLGARRDVWEATGQTHRLSWALRHFKQACAANRRRRHQKADFLVLRERIQRQLIGHVWSRWKQFARLAKTKTVFCLWMASNEQRRLESAMQLVSANTKVKVMACTWNWWRKRAGAQTLARLLHAWVVIGPVRKCLRALRCSARETKGAERQRHRLLRKALRDGFIAFLDEERRSKSAISRARDYEGRHILRKSLRRWVVGHRLSRSIAMWQHRVDRTKKRASIDLWLKTAFREGESRASTICRRDTAVRYARLLNGLKRWRARVISSQRLQRGQDDASMMRRVRSLRRGLTRFNSWTQFRYQRDLERSTRLCFYRKSLAAGLLRWQRRVAHVADAHFKIRDFQLRWRMYIGVVRLRRWTTNRRANRLLLWRAGVWAEGFGITNALRIWRRHSQAHTDMKAALRIAHNRSLERNLCRRFSPLRRYIFGALKSHAQATELKRRVLRAWFSRTESVTRARKQVEAFLLRSGLEALQRRVRLSKFRRHRRLRASKHRNHVVFRTIFHAWKNKIYPLGVPSQWAPRRCPYTKEDGRGAMNITTILPERQQKLALPFRDMRCLEITEAAKAHDWRSSSRCASLVLLRLPLIGQRMRRVLYVWRKRAKQEKRLRFIRNALRHKITSTPKSNKALASPQDVPDTDAAQVLFARRRCCPGIRGGDEPDTKGLTRRIGDSAPGCSNPGGYLHLHLLSSAEKRVKPFR